MARLAGTQPSPAPDQCVLVLAVAGRIRLSGSQQCLAVGFADVIHVLSVCAASGTRCLPAAVGLFAVWSVHRGCDPDGVFSRTERRRWVNCVTVYLLYHVEHHLFSRVPANHLPELARRLDAVAPEWTGQRVLVPARSAGRQWPTAA
ncbi:fatty acid desaturase [Neisseria sp.]|uniref:fatty acid desaturase n=1 Tax=Neisseria sp. TaxID=192066 RepID=UPI0034C6CB8C